MDLFSGITCHRITLRLTFHRSLGMLHRTEDTERLSRIATMWDMLRQANEPADAGASHEAQRVLMERYCTSVHRYLLGALRDEDAAGELFQEFALRFLRG